MVIVQTIHNKAKGVRNLEIQLLFNFLLTCVFDSSLVSKTIGQASLLRLSKAVNEKEVPNVVEPLIVIHLS